MSNSVDIWLHRDDLQTILEFVDSCNPDDGTNIRSGRVCITYDNCSGIGYTLTAKVPVALNGYNGNMEISVVDESAW